MEYDEWFQQNEQFLIKFLKETVSVDVQQIRRNTHELTIFVGSEIIAKETIHL